MATSQKQKRRGFVMTGGGAKGLYEAGVIHAFHITGMEFDVITGSSIGAMNSVFFAEYLLHKQKLEPEILTDPARTIEVMDPMVKAFHHAWLLVPEKRIIDDSETGPIGQLKDDLLEFNLDLPSMTRLAWWWTDPKRNAVPSPVVWPSLAKLLKELVERLGGSGELLHILKDHRDAPVEEAIRTYLRRFDLEKSLIPEGDDRRIQEVFTQPVTPLNIDHLLGDVTQEDGRSQPAKGLIDPQRTLRDYAQAGIDVRLTRANYRTGRLELSMYVSAEDFLHYLEKQSWRIRAEDPDKIPLGSFRLQIPGNPNAIDAALASGRFPGVFAPFPVTDLYPADDAENAMALGLLKEWLASPEVKEQLSQAFFKQYDDSEQSQERWERLYSGWRDSNSMRDFFPQIRDAYLDGGAIDNTPSNSAIDAVREWAERSGVSKRDVVLDLYIVFLHSEPRVSADEAQSPAAYQVVNRTLDIQGVAKQSSDAVVVDTINHFGDRGEELGRALHLLLESYQDTIDDLDQSRREEIEGHIREVASELGLRGFRGSSGAGIMERMLAWSEHMLAERLPLPVAEVKIHPEEMPLNTLQFTERLGYRKESAIRMLTMGCYNTLWALRVFLEAHKPPLDEQDQSSLALARQWMGFEEWPSDPDLRVGQSEAWRCQRTGCVFHALHCPHGEMLIRK